MSAPLMQRTAMNKFDYESFLHEAKDKGAKMALIVSAIDGDHGEGKQGYDRMNAALVQRRSSTSSASRALLLPRSR